MKYVKSTIVSLLMLCASHAFAQSVYPPDPAQADNTLGAVYPYQGTYYDPNQAGTGIQVDVGANGNAFVTLYSYTATGQPDWYILQAKYQPSDEVTRWTTGVIGTMTGPFYQAFNGQCLGCPYTPTGGAVAAPFTPTLTWVNSREVKMTVGSQNWDFIAPNLDSGSDGDYLPGIWLTTATFLSQPPNFPTNRFTITQPLRMQPVPFPVVVAAGSSNETAYSVTATAYLATCDSGSPGLPSKFNTMCTNFIFALVGGPAGGGRLDLNAQPVPIFWFDKVSNRFGMDAAALKTVNGRQTYVIGPGNIHCDLYLDGPHNLSGRGIIEGTQLSFSVYRQGGLAFSITMSKVPYDVRTATGFYAQ